MLPSYGVKRKLEKNNFLLLGAMRILLGITKDDWGTKVKRTLSKRAGFILKTLYYLQEGHITCVFEHFMSIEHFE